MSSNETQAGLRISHLQLSDEGLYRCEITYLEINEGCPVVQYVNLTVLGMSLSKYLHSSYGVWIKELAGNLFIYRTVKGALCVGKSFV